MPPVGSYCRCGSAGLRSNDLSTTSVPPELAAKAVAETDSAVRATTPTTSNGRRNPVRRRSVIGFLSLLLTDKWGRARWPCTILEAVLYIGVTVGFQPC